MIEPWFFRQPASAVSHLGFAMWAAYAAVLLIRLAPPTQRRAFGLFGGGMVFLYAASGVYHSIPADWPLTLELFRRLDLAGIHVLIAGTCTPPFAVLLPERTGRTLLVLVWSIAVLGALSKLILPLPPHHVTIALYAGTAVLGLLPMAWLARLVGVRYLAGLISGVLVYGMGATCEALQWPTPWPGVVGPHEVLHMCDIGGSLLHLGFMFGVVLPAAWESRYTSSRRNSRGDEP